MYADIAVVSFERFLHGTPEERCAVAGEIYQAFSSVGWVYIKDHGIPQERVDQIFALAKEFFSLPLETKLEYRLSDPQLNQGYTADGAESNGGIDHKECYEHRRFRNLCCPPSSVLPHFRSTLDEFYAQCLALGLQVLKCLAMALNLGDDFFDAITTSADPQMRLLHYPEIDRETIEREGHARIVPHTDFGLATLLFQDTVGGLEVDPFHTGEFKAARPIPGTVLINIADLLQRLTNGRCRSTLHRVVSPPASGNIVPSRYSIPFFIHPNPETMIEPITLSPSEGRQYETVNAGEWRIWKTKTNYGMQEGPSAAIAA